MRVRASVYNGYLQGRVTITPTLPGLGLLRLRFEHVTQPSACDEVNSLIDCAIVAAWYIVKLSPSCISIIDTLISALYVLVSLAAVKIIIGVRLNIYFPPHFFAKLLGCHTPFACFVIYENDQCPFNVKFWRARLAFIGVHRCSPV